MTNQNNQNIRQLSDNQFAVDNAYLTKKSNSFGDYWTVRPYGSNHEQILHPHQPVVASNTVFNNLGSNFFGK